MYMSFHAQLSFDAHNMTITDEYFHLNKLLLLTVGLWPYNRSKLVEFQLFLFVGIIASFIIVQFTTFITAECTSALIIKVLCRALYFAMYLIKYISFYFNMKTIKYLLDKFEHIYDELHNEDEVAIIKEYGKTSNRITIIFSLIGLCSILIVWLLPLCPRILSTYMFINISETHFMIQIVREYFIDQEKYFYFILLHMDIAIGIAAIVLLAIGTLLLAYFKNISGMFKIASYRIECAMAIPLFHNAGLSNKGLIHKQIVHAVDIHRKGMELCDIIISTFTTSFCFLLLVGVISLSLNLYGFYQAMMLRNALEEILIYFMITAVILSYMFISNYGGQEITDHYNHIFSIVYNVQWYLAPLDIQKMILFLLQRGTKPFHLVIGGLFVVSMESAAMLLSTSISYFTVLYSTRS